MFEIRKKIEIQEFFKKKLTRIKIYLTFVKKY